MKGGTRPGAGRKPNPPEEATRPRSVRLNDARWEKLKRLGSDWLARAIDRGEGTRLARVAAGESEEG